MPDGDGIGRGIDGVLDIIGGCSKARDVIGLAVRSLTCTEVLKKCVSLAREESNAL